MSKASILLICFLLLLLNACTKSDLFQSQGSISGSLQGNSQDGESLDESFDYSEFTTYNAMSNYTINTDNTYFTIQRESIADDQSYIQLTFRKLNSGILDYANVRIQYSKKLDDSKMLFYSASNTATIVITSFDESSGRIVGTYSASITKINSNTSVKNVCTLTGKFDVIVYNIVR